MSNKKVAVSKKNSSVKRENEMIVSPKNYLYAFIIFVVIIALVVYLFAWYQIKRQEKLMTSYLLTTNTVMSSINDLNALNQIMQDAPTSYFIYIGYANSEEVYDLEVELKKVIDKYKLNDIFYYLDVTDLKENDENYINKIKQSLNINNLDNVPAIIYVTNGEIKEENILDGVKGTNFKVNDFKKLLDIYDFEIIK